MREGVSGMGGRGGDSVFEIWLILRGLYSDFYSPLYLTIALLTNAIFVDFPE